MGLLKPAWQSGNEGKAVRAVAKIEDQALLADIANNGSCCIGVRVAAARKLSDKKLAQEIYASILKGAGRSNERLKALHDLADQDLLVDVVINTHNGHPYIDDDWTVCAEAVRKITDQHALEGIAKGKVPDVVRLAAVRELTGQALLADIAKTDTNIFARITAVKNLQDQTLLVDVIRSNASYEEIGVREAAFERLTDQAVLADFIKKGWRYKDLQMAGIDRLTDQAMLADIVKNAAVSEYTAEVLQEAIRKLTDRDVLNEIANDQTDKYCCEWEKYDDGSNVSAIGTDLRLNARNRLNELGIE